MMGLFGSVIGLSVRAAERAFPAPLLGTSNQGRLGLARRVKSGSLPSNDPLDSIADHVIREAVAMACLIGVAAAIHVGEIEAPNGA